MKKRLLCALLALSLLTLPGCKRAPEPVEFSTFAMDTMMSFTLYGDKEKCAIARSTIGMILSDYEAALSATREDGGIAKVNRADGQPVELGSPQLLERTLELCEVTGGALDITAYPAVKPDVVDAGATWTDANETFTNAVVDGNLVTAPAWPAHPAWMAAFIRMLGGTISV